MGYEFVNLSPVELAQRRISLNDAGHQAWLSPIIVLSLIYAYRRLLEPYFISSNRQRATDSLNSLSGFTIIIRKILWILNTPVIPEFGALHVQLIGIFYLLWLLYLIFKDTGKDYLHLTKAFGHVAISQLPLHYLLAQKSPTSPITMITGLTHERLNAYHRLFGRIVHSLVAAHAILYLRFFVLSNILSKRIKDTDVRLGLAAFWSFNIMGLLAIPPIRRKVYHKVFYRSHVLFSGLILVLLFLHVPYTRRYVGQAIMLWFLNGYMRMMASEEVKISCEKVKNTDLLQVKVKLRQKNSPIGRWIPGQHVYLNKTSLGPKNPFTIVGERRDSNGNLSELRLVVRNLNGPQTKYLGDVADSGKISEMLLEGPYGEASQYLPSILDQGENAGPCLFVAGGVGITYTLPIFIASLRARGSSSDIKLIWIAKTQEETRWAMKELGQVGLQFDMDIYITKPAQAANTEEANGETRPSGLHLYQSGRPNLEAICEKPFTNASDEKSSHLNSKEKLEEKTNSQNRLTVFVCGPPGLSSDLRKAVGKHLLQHNRNIQLYEEQFGFGGS